MLRLSIILALCACVSAVNLGNICTLDTDCTQTEVYCNINSPCTNGTCACLTGWTENSGNTACIQINIKAVGEACNTVENLCSGDHTTCTLSVCQCEDGYYGESGDYDCDFGTNVTTIGDYCTYDADCEAYKHYYERNAQRLLPELNYQTALCSGGQCVCNTDYVASTGKTTCISDLAAYGEMCSDDGDCDTYAHMNAECVSNTCGCGTGYTLRTSFWNINTYLEDQCVEDGTLISLGSGVECWNEEQSELEHYCGKGLTCSECPGDSSVRICQSSGAVFGVSLAIMLGALFLHL